MILLTSSFIAFLYCQNLLRKIQVFKVSDDSPSTNNASAFNVAPSIRPTPRQQVASTAPSTAVPFSWKSPAPGKPSTPPLNAVSVAPTSSGEQKTKAIYCIPKLFEKSVPTETEKTQIRPQERNERVFGY